MPDNGTCIHAVNTHQVLIQQIILDGLFGHPSAVLHRVVLDHQPGYLDVLALGLLTEGTVVTDMRIGHQQDLACIAGVSKNFLVTGHAGVEADLAGGGTDLGSAEPMVCGSILEEEYCRHLFYSLHSGP